jgi:tripartite-type tricarboxylate transporter receptor subunit TctC
VDYPVKNVRILVGSPPGSGGDITMRMFTPALSAAAGQTFLVDNRAGAAGGVMLNMLAQAAPDGYTLGNIAAQHVSAMVIKTINVDIPNAIEPALIVSTKPYLLLGSPSLPVSTVKDLVAYSKKNQLAYASSGVGSVVHLGMELLNFKAGMKMLHVPYKGAADMLTDLMAGRVQVAIINTLSAKPFVDSGKVKALGITDRSRSHLLPDVPTIVEGGIAGFELGSWNGLGAPKGTPPQVISKINRVVLGVLNSPEIKSKFTQDGGEVAPAHPPSGFRDLIAKEKAMWEALVKSGSLKID